MTAMGARESGLSPSDPARRRNPLRAWRRQRTGGGRFPLSLWALAVRLAKVQGVRRTAAVLGLGNQSSGERAEAVAGESQSSAPAFVDLPAPVPLGNRCLFGLASGRPPPRSHCPIQVRRTHAS
jgi:hypothetical protein